MKKLFSLLAAVLFAGSMMAADELKATLDFSTNVWNLPEGSGAGATAAADFNDGTYTITLAATTKYYFNSDGYLMLGKSGSTLTLPAFAWNTTKIVVTGRTGASTSTVQNIYVGDEAVSTATTGCTGVNEYAIAEAYQEAGNGYVLKSGSNHNAQIVKIEIYGEGEGGGEGGEGGEGIEYDEDADLSYTFYSYTIDDEYLSEYGDVYVEASDEDGYEVVLDIYLPEGATTLTPGVYPINDTYAASSVAAGDYYEGNIFPSFAAILDAEGYISNVWYLVSGAIAIDEELNILVSAQNSLGHDIVLTIYANGEGSAVEATKAEIKAIKRIENGQLVIIKNGVKYNAVGTVVR